MVLCKSKGTVIVDQTRKKLEVINHYPDEGVYRNCKELLEKHELRLRCSPSWKLINQVSLRFEKIISSIHKTEKKIKTYLFSDPKTGCNSYLVVYGNL